MKIRRIVFVAPALLFFSAVVIAPALINLLYAFTNWDGYGGTFSFVGLRNFSRLVSDPDVLKALTNTLIYTVIEAPLQVAIGLILALIVNRPGKAIAALRVVIVLPIAISGVVLGFLGSIIFDPNTGILQAVGQVHGLGGLAQNWLGNPQLAMITVIAMTLWQWSGFTMLIFLAGLATVPKELHEAAMLDGAGPWRRFVNVTWPLIAPSATINVVLGVIGGLKVFDIIYVLTMGGPGDATRSVVMLVNAQSSFASYGYSAAISFALTLLMILVSLTLLWFLRRREFTS
jgi:raffinose/stachyose/melibiose transport system permease protein